MNVRQSFIADNRAKTSSIWTGNFSELKVGDFGTPGFQGRYHPEIPYQMMLRYTEPGDLVWDPFAGCGTTIDVGKLLGRQVIASDLRPIREDILGRDATAWFPIDPVDLVICHPPYWKMIRFTDDVRDLSNCSTLNDYRLAVAAVIDNVGSALKRQKKFVVVISDFYHQSEQIPLGMVWLEEAFKLGFKLKGKIVKDFGETHVYSKNRGLLRYRLLRYGLWELGIDEIYVLENSPSKQWLRY